MSGTRSSKSAARLACIARLCLVIETVLGMASQGTAALQRNQTDPKSARAFQELFQHFVQGDADAAVRTFAAWDDDRIENEAQLAPGTAGNELKPALALFHTEAYLRQGPAARAQHESAGRLKNKERCPAADVTNDATILGLCRDWYTVAVVAGDVFDYTRDFLPGSASVQLARGAIAEFAAGPALESGGGADHGSLARTLDGPYVVTSHGRFGRTIAEAESSLRRALKIDPQLAEARARLGHVLFKLDRRDEARKELERAFADAGMIGDTYPQSRAALFRGRLP